MTLTIYKHVGKKPGSPDNLDLLTVKCRKGIAIDTGDDDLWLTITTEEGKKYDLRIKD